MSLSIPISSILFLISAQIDTSNLADVAASDLAIIAKAAQVSEDAETGTGGFNDAIAAAGGTQTTAGTALQNGKIKNKVLKLQTDVLRLQIEQAQGKSVWISQGSKLQHMKGYWLKQGLDIELQQQITKLNTNVALDKATAGQTSQSVSFSGTD